MALQGHRVVLASVDDQPKWAARRDSRGQKVQTPSDTRDVGLVAPVHGSGDGVSIGPAAGAAVGSGIGSEDEPRAGSDGQAHPESPVLPFDETFEVVVSDGFSDLGDVRQGPALKQDRVPGESIGQTSDGGLGARARARELSVGGAGHEARGDFCREVATLKIVGEREGLAGACVTAVEASVAGNASAVAGSEVGAVPMETANGSDVSGTLGPGAEGRTEARGAYALNGSRGPAHAGPRGKSRTRGGSAERRPVRA